MSDNHQTLFQRRVEDLRRNTDFLRTLLETVVAYAIIAADFDGNILAYNEGARQVYGYAPEEVIGAKEFQALFPQEVIQSGKLQEMTGVLLEQGRVSYEGEKLRKNGESFPAQIMFTLTKDRKGNVKGFVEIVEDLTERKRAEQAEAEARAAATRLRQLEEYSAELEEMVEQRTKELKEAQEELVRKEKLATLGQLAGGVGHELRNPLGVMSNAVYFLKATLTEADATTKEYLDIIAAEVQTADKIIGDLLGFSRTRPAEREKTTVSDLVKQALQRQPVPEGVEVRTEVSAELAPVRVDRGQIGQVLVNLVSNACQAMPQGGTLTIGAEPSKGGPTRSQQSGIQIHVADTGCGMSKETLKKVFEPLFTTNARGIGLGLAVSKNLVENNGGSIEAQSQEGKGSTFTIVLPSNGEAT